MRQTVNEMGRKILIFGNSGSGKSTLAARLCRERGLAHLDLDTLAWLPDEQPRRRPLAESAARINDFIASHRGWVIEGCYGDLLALLLDQADEMIFLDLPVAQCVANARSRPWEPHKYPSREAQDANLEMLIQWIEDYPQRTDGFSRAAHLALFERFGGRRIRYADNRRDD